jgi:7-carboxy-7-deazaguanine synthase
MSLNNKLPINEFFATIQGEATYIGTPSFFLRVQKCPVGCGFCDTKYTWDLNPEDETDNIQEIIDKNSLDFSKGEGNSRYVNLSNDQIIKLVDQNKMNHVVFTGGEPCIYDLTDITEILHQKGYSTQIETSGTFEIRTSDKTWVTVSPKIGKSIQGGYEVLESSYKRANEIKYPVGKQKDIDHLKEVVELHDLGSKIIWLQPLSVSEKATELCIDKALENNWRISIQAHKYINVR